jgi:pyruvate,water dikinase
MRAAGAREHVDSPVLRVPQAADATGFPLPEDLRVTWTFDRAHSPRVLTPLAQAVVLRAAQNGINDALREVDYPASCHIRPLNGYTYFACESRDVAYSTGDLSSALARVVTQWQAGSDQWFPGIGLISANYAQLREGSLIARQAKLTEALRMHWRAHVFRLLFNEAVSAFVDFFLSAIPTEDPLEPYILAGGFEQRSKVAICALWDLSRVMRRRPELSNNIMLFTRSADLLTPLRERTRVVRFLEKVRGFAGKYGTAMDSSYELAEPSLRESPTALLNVLHTMAGCSAAEDPELRFRVSSDRRQTALTRARSALNGDSERRSQFEALLEDVRIRGELLRKYEYQPGRDHLALRLTYRELGRRLVSCGSIANADDVFLLTEPDIVDGLNGLSNVETVSSRRAEMVAHSRLNPPVRAARGPHRQDFDPFVGMMAKIEPPPDRQEQRAVLLRGKPGAPGSIRARAKTARTFEEASRIARGQVLVCEVAPVSWSILLLLAAGIVVDHAGPLSECASQAREFGIPCVVATNIATNTIVDGSLVEVNGSTGEVRVLRVPE